MALNKARVLALNTAHVLHLDKADVLALNKAHVLHLNNKICPVFGASTKETTKGGGRPKAARTPLWRRPKAASLCAGSEHWAYLIVEMQDMCLVESQDIRLVQMQDVCCVES